MPDFNAAARALHFPRRRPARPAPPGTKATQGNTGAQRNEGEVEVVELPKMKSSRSARGAGRGFSPMPPMPGIAREDGKAKRKYAPVSWRVDASGLIVGDCNWCGETHRAMGLVDVPEYKVPDGNGGMRTIEPGWGCSACKPKLFGKVSGKSSTAIPGMEAVR